MLRQWKTARQRRTKEKTLIDNTLLNTTQVQPVAATTNKEKLKSNRRITSCCYIAIFFLVPIIFMGYFWFISVYNLPLTGESSTIKATVHNGVPIKYPRIMKEPNRGGNSLNSGTTKNVKKSVLTIYLESPSTLDMKSIPLKTRNTVATNLRKVEFPNMKTNCNTVIQQELPIDDFPIDDPYMPWIHDYFHDNHFIHFIAQNKRRCETGVGKTDKMKFWEPQISLFQSIPIKYENDTKRFRLSTPDNEATVNETRFICHFHTDDDLTEQTETTLSVYSFNYEYVLWRKGRLPMYKETGADVSKFELSQLLFSCPIPEQFQKNYNNKNNVLYYLDLIPIRTPARKDQQLFTIEQIGIDAHRTYGNNLFDTMKQFGSNHYLPAIQDSGRWSNLPICPPPKEIQNRRNVNKEEKPYRIVACTWTAASYMRRGDANTISDSPARLKEWILFHRLVGIDHLYVYDNTQISENDGEISPLREIVELFPDYVTYHPWPAKVCSNNRPNNKNPGERSSQYAAEASCRTRYGPLTDWITFIDTDEYLVPMRKNNETWYGILNDMEKRGLSVLKMRSSRGRPRIDYMDITDDPNICQKPKGQQRNQLLPEEPCAIPRQNETYLRIYNCDYIRHPRPDRFARAMKQIYKPTEVLSHFVHYSTITRNLARYYIDYEDNGEEFRRQLISNGVKEIFLNEIHEGVLIHAKSVLPHETMTRTASCHNASKHTCAVGFACPDTTAFIDAIHQKNLFHDEHGNFCNCWVDHHTESYWIPLLEKEFLNLLSH